MTLASISMSEKDKARFWTKVKPSRGCWEWAGVKNANGYGVFCNKGDRLSHRISYSLLKGPVEKNLELCHTCDNPSCVNPNHLFKGTHQDNMRDMKLKARNRKKNSRSKYYGVSYRSDTAFSRWRCYIDLEGNVRKHLGSFTTEIEAAKHYDRIAFKEYGFRDRLNFPEDWIKQRGQDDKKVAEGIDARSSTGGDKELSCSNIVTSS